MSVFPLVRMKGLWLLERLTMVSLLRRWDLLRCPVIAMTLSAVLHRRSRAGPPVLASMILCWRRSHAPTPSRRHGHMLVGVRPRRKVRLRLLVARMKDRLIGIKLQRGGLECRRG